MCFVIIIERLFYFCRFRVMTQQSILHVVVNCKVFTINICCFIAKISFQISICTIFSISPYGLEAKSTPPWKMLSKLYIKDITFSIFNMATVHNLGFSNLKIIKFLVADRVRTTNVHRRTNFIKINQIIKMVVLCHIEFLKI